MEQLFFRNFDGFLKDLMKSTMEDHRTIMKAAMEEHSTVIKSPLDAMNRVDLMPKLPALDGIRPVDQTSVIHSPSDWKPS